MQRPQYQTHTRRQLSDYAFLMATVCLLLGVLFWWRAEQTVTGAAAALGCATGVWIVVGLVAPARLRPIYHAWMWLAFVLNFAVSRVLLMALFLFVLLPLSVVARFVGHDPLGRSKRHSYWKRYLRQAPRRHFERMYAVSEVRNAKSGDAADST